MSRPILLPHPWDALAEKVGGVGKLAEDHFGVSERTLRRWAVGDTRTPGPAKVVLEGLLKRFKVAS